jgi:cellobiose-specific phosphotransferase system component IIA
MGTIKQATYGDEKSSTDVTDVIVKMYKEGKNSLSVVAGPSILSKREAGVKVSHNDEENQEIRKQALESCGNALDANCMKTTQDSLRSSKLEEKAQTSNRRMREAHHLRRQLVVEQNKNQTAKRPKTTFSHKKFSKTGSQTPPKKGLKIRARKNFCVVKNRL